MYVYGEADGYDGGLNGFITTDLEYVGLNFNVSNEPQFVGDYALVEMENDGGVAFITLIDRTGEMMFEPVKGYALSEPYFFSDYVASVEGQGIVEIYPDGTMKPIIENSRLSEMDDLNYICVNDQCFTIEEGQIVPFDYE